MSKYEALINTLVEIKAHLRGVKRKKAYLYAHKMIMLNYDRRKRKCQQNTSNAQTDKKLK